MWTECCQSGLCLELDFSTLMGRALEKGQVVSLLAVVFETVLSNAMDCFIWVCYYFISSYSVANVCFRFYKATKYTQKNLKNHLIAVNCNKLSRTHPCPIPPSSESQDLKNEVEFSTQVAQMLFHSMFSVYWSPAVLLTGFSCSMGHVRTGAEQQHCGCAGHLSASAWASSSSSPAPLLSKVFVQAHREQMQTESVSWSFLQRDCINVLVLVPGRSTGTEMNGRGTNN